MTEKRKVELEEDESLDLRKCKVSSYIFELVLLVIYLIYLRRTVG